MTGWRQITSDLISYRLLKYFFSFLNNSPRWICLLCWLAKEYKADEATIQTYRAAYQTSGWRGVMQEQARRFELSNERYFFGGVYNAQAGNKDKAFNYLEKSYQRREMWMAYPRVDPRLDPLRDDPRFDELVRRVESR